MSDAAGGRSFDNQSEPQCILFLIMAIMYSVEKEEFRMNKNKSVKLMMAVLLSASMCGCGSEAEPGPDTDSKEKETETAPETAPETAVPEESEISSEDQVYHVGDTITADDFIFTLSDAGFAGTVSKEADDSFLLKADEGMEIYDGALYLYYAVDYQFTGSFADEEYYSFFTDRYTVGNTSFMTDGLTVFRKAGGDWTVSGCGTRFQSIAASVGGDLSGKYTYEPSDEKYEAHGILIAEEKNLTEDSVIIELMGYKFEISK